MYGYRILTFVRPKGGTELNSETPLNASAPRIVHPGHAELVELLGLEHVLEGEEVLVSLGEERAERGCDLCHSLDEEGLIRVPSLGDVDGGIDELLSPAIGWFVRVSEPVFER